ncbi:MAG: phosphoribosylglycinamide formyltransferase [Rhodospirillaceae bacterium]|nr:MAG: phosphoribosylglycinamide formyltransferase [Rhodospirillaceae bacterium]
MKIAVLISGRGSNLQALIDAANQPGWPAEIVLVISNVAGAQGLERAKAAGIPTTVINHKDFEDRETFDASMTEAIEKSAAGNGAELVCLAGFMRILSTHFIDHWRDRLINIHPSRLPDYKGLNVHQRVLDAGERITGCTVHFVRQEMDTGPIVIQASVPVHDSDDAGTLAARVLEQEHQIYPQAVRLIAQGRVTVDGEQAMIDGEILYPAE